MPSPLIRRRPQRQHQRQQQWAAAAHGRAERTGEKLFFRRRREPVNRLPLEQELEDVTVPWGSQRGQDTWKVRGRGQSARHGERAPTQGVPGSKRTR